jgi:hypothetical protein
MVKKKKLASAAVLQSGGGSSGDLLSKDADIIVSRTF